MRSAKDRVLGNISLKRDEREVREERGWASCLWDREKKGEDLFELDRIVQWRDIASYSTSHEFSSTSLTKSLNGVGDSTHWWM